MATPRIIPVLLCKNGRLILSRKFKFHQDIGSIKYVGERLKAWDVDEIMLLNISAYSSKRSGTPYDSKAFLDVD